MNFLLGYRSTVSTDKTGNRYVICHSGDTMPDEHISDQEDVVPEPVASNNTCTFCKNDFDPSELGLLSVYPICASCRTRIQKKEFPLWVKCFFGGVLVIVLFSVFWNWRFYSAYLDIKNSNIKFAQKDMPGASYLMSNASKKVPESYEVSSLASYYKGIILLGKDSSTKALEEFENCKDLPSDYHINELVLQAEMGSGFDKKDYQLFLTSAKAFLQVDTTQASSFAGVASAYACLYVKNNVDSLKLQSLKYLNRARAIDDTSAQAKEYVGRIMYRLDKKEIINKAEYDKKYPTGYISNK